MVRKYAQEIALASLAGAGLIFLLSTQHKGGVPNLAESEVRKARNARPKFIQVTTSRGKFWLYPSARSPSAPIWAEFDQANKANALLFDDSTVLLLTNRTEARAYPILFLDAQEILFDQFNGETLLITYCGLTDSPAVYRCDDGLRPTNFVDSEYILESNLVMRDTRTRSLWDQLTGTCFSGSLMGRRLRPVPSYSGTLGAATEHFTELKVMRPPPSFLRKVSRSGVSTRPMETMDRPGPDYPLSDFDPALSLRERVLGVAVGGLKVAIPISNAPSTNHFGNITLRTRFWLDFPIAERLTIDGEWEPLTNNYCYWFAWYLTHRDTIVVPRSAQRLLAQGIPNGVRPNGN